MATSELVKLFERLPEQARAVFAPLELDGKPYVAPKESPKPAEPAPKPESVETPVEVKAVETKPIEAKSDGPKPPIQDMPRTSSPTRPRPPTAPRLTSERSAPVTAAPPITTPSSGTTPPPVTTSSPFSEDEKWEEPK
jgi:hypothetical protein